VHLHQGIHMEFDNEILKLRTEVDKFYHACLGAKQLKFKDVDNYLNLRNAYNNSLKQIVILYQEKQKEFNSSKPLKTQFQLSCQTLLQAIQQSQENLQAESKKELTMLLKAYDDIAHIEARKSTLKHIKSIQNQIKGYIVLLAQAESSLKSTTIKQLDKQFLKHFEFSKSYPAAIQNIKQLLNDILEKQINLTHVSKESEPEINAESFLVIANEFCSSLNLPQKNIKDFACIVKFAIELQNQPEALSQSELNANTFVSLLDILLSLNDACLKITEFLDILNDDKKFSTPFLSLQNGLNNYINEVERSILLLENNLSETTLFLKEVSKNFQLFEGIYSTPKEINNIIKKVSLLSEKLKKLIIQKFEFQASDQSLDKRMQLKVAGFECYHSFEECYHFKQQISALKNNLLNLEDQLLSNNLCSFKNSYLIEIKTNQQSLFNVIMDKIEVELNVLRGNIVNNQLTQFTNDYLDGYYFYECKRISNKYIDETAYAVLMKFDMNKILHFIMDRIGDIPKENIENSLELAEKIAILTLDLAPTANNIETCQNLLNILLAKRYHKYAYRLHIKLQSISSEHNSIFYENKVIENLSGHIEQIAQNGANWDGYDEFIYDFSNEIRNTFHLHYSHLKPSDFTNDNWQINSIIYDAMDNPLKNLMRLSEMISIFTIQSIILIGETPRLNLKEVENVYQFFLDLTDKLIECKEFNAVLSIYSALTSAAISNLGAYIKMPAVERFKDTLDLDNNGFTNLIKLEKSAIHPTIYIRFQEYNEIDSLNKHLPSLLTETGRFLSNVFTKINKKIEFKNKPIIDMQLSEYIQLNTWIKNRGIKNALDTESYFLDISRKINIPLDEMTSVELLGTHLTRFYEFNKVLRFNNNESTNDIARKILFLVKSSELPEFNNVIKTLSLTDSFDSESIFSNFITPILSAYKSAITNMLESSFISIELKTKIIIFYKSFSENYIISEIKNQYAPDHTVHSIINDLNSILNKNSFIEEGIRSLSHPNILALEQIIKNTGLTTVNILPEAINYFITKFDPENPIESEKEFNEFLLKRFLDELTVAAGTVDAAVQVPAIIRFINSPIKNFSITESVTLANEILTLTSPVNLNKIEKYILFLDALKEHFSEYKLLFSAFSEGHELIKNIQALSNEVLTVLEHNKNNLDNSDIESLESIHNSLTLTIEGIRDLANTYNIETLPLLLEDLSNDHTKFSNLFNEYNILNNRIQEDAHFSDKDQFLSLSDSRHPLYHAMQIFYLNSSKDSLEHMPENIQKMSLQAINNNLISLTNSDSNLTPVKLYKTTLQLATKDLDAYSDINRFYLSLTEDLDKSSIKDTFSLNTLHTPECILRATLTQLVFLDETKKERAFQLLNIMKSESIINTTHLATMVANLKSMLEESSQSNLAFVIDTINGLNKLLAVPVHQNLPELIIKPRIKLIDEFNKLIQGNDISVGPLLKDLNSILQYKFAQSSVFSNLPYTDSLWYTFLNEVSFAFLNFYTSSFNLKVRKKIATLYVILCEQSLLEKNVVLTLFFMSLIDSPTLSNDYAISTQQSNQDIEKIKNIKSLLRDETNLEFPNLVSAYQGINDILNSHEQHELKFSKLGDIYSKLYLFHNYTTTQINRNIIETDVSDFIKRYSIYLPIHEASPNLSRDKYLSWAHNNISPLISAKNVLSLSNLSVFFKNSDNLMICFIEKDNSKTILSGKQVKVKLFQKLEATYSKKYNEIASGNIDQIQALVRDYLIISNLFEEYLLRLKMKTSPEISKLYTFILHPELIYLHRWMINNKRKKRNSLFKVVGKDPELDALWRVNAIIEKLSAIDALTKSLSNKLSVEKILQLKSIQRKMMALGFEIKETYDNSLNSVEAGKFMTFDQLDIFHWARNYHKFSEEIYDVIGLKPTTKNTKSSKWGWRQALALLGIGHKFSETSMSNPVSHDDTEEMLASESDIPAPYLSMPSHTSARQKQLLSSLQVMLEGAPQIQTEYTEQTKSNKKIEPFSTQFLINSFLQSFDWGTDDIRIDIPPISNNNAQVNLLGATQYIPNDLQLEVVSLVIVCMDMISKYAGSEGEYAPLNINKIDSLVTIISQANNAINKYFIDTQVPPTNEKIYELTEKFKLKKNKLIQSNLQLYMEAKEGLSSSISINPSASKFLHFNENIMQQMLVENIFELEYKTVLSPINEDVDSFNAENEDDETKALLDLLLNQEDYPEDKKPAH
jgi:hypothetical protein